MSSLVTNKISELENNLSFSNGLATEFINLNYNNLKSRSEVVKGLEDFFSFMERSFFQVYHEPNNYQAIHFKRYLDYLEQDARTLKGTKLAQNTIAKRLSLVKNFWSYLETKQVIIRDESKLVKYKKTENLAEYIALTIKQVESVVDTYSIEKLTVDCINNKNRKASFKKYMSLCAFKILVYTGLREDELARLKFKHIKRKNGVSYIEVLGKGKKLRTIPVDDALVLFLNSIKRMFKLTWGISLTSSDYIFQTAYYKTGRPNEKPADNSSVYRVIKAISKDSRLRTDFSPHDLRASYITQLLNEGVDIYQVSLWAGHSSVETTKRYDKNRTRLEHARTPFRPLEQDSLEEILARVLP